MHLVKKTFTLEALTKNDNPIKYKGYLNLKTPYGMVGLIHILLKRLEINLSQMKKNFVAIDKMENLYKK